MRLSSPAVAMAASPIRPSLTASQRVRVTLWLQVSRRVPASSSRATSGAPQNRPMPAGAPYTTAMPTKASTSLIEPCSPPAKVVVARAQSPCAWHPVIPLAAYRWARCGPVTASSTASTASPAAVTIVWARNWRQVSHIIAVPPERGRRGRPSGQAALADPPEAEPGQGQGQDREDRGLVPLERPVAARGLIGEHLPQVQRAQRVLAGREGVRLAQAGRGGRPGEYLTGRGNGLVGQDPGTR